MSDKIYKFSLGIRKEENFYIAKCFEIDVVSQGKSVEEALANIKEAIILYIESFGDEDIPSARDETFFTPIEVHT